MMRSDDSDIPAFRRQPAPWYPGEAAPRQGRRRVRLPRGIFLLALLVMFATFGAGMLVLELAT